jgi:hypothetical protein
VDGSVGGGGESVGKSAGGGELARVTGGSELELTNGSLGGSPGGDVFAKGAGGSGDGLGQASAMSGDPAAGSVLDGGHALDGGEADLAERLETLARSLPQVDGTTLADSGTTTAPDGMTPAASGFEPSWLGAGALVRAPHVEPLPQVYRCPSCRTPLSSRPRFCGYCGEPLDKTLA